MNAPKVIEAEPQTSVTILPDARDVTPLMLLDRALSRGMDPGTLEKLMDLQDRHERNQARRAFDAAVAAAKAEFPVIRKNRVVDFVGKTGIRTHYEHEDLAEIARTVDPILGKHGLSYRFRTASPVNEPVSVTCILSHKDGHSEENTLHGPRDESGNKNPLQSIGSTISFLQRYTLKAALGMAAAADDDGRASGGAGGPVSEEQVEAMRAKIVEVAADLPRFLKTFGIERLDEMPASRFDEAMRKLAAKAKAAEKAA